jgi:4-carboxymuconolactone decarboxylase
MRRPWVRTDELTPAQRPLYEAFEEMVRADEYTGFQVKRPDGAFIGPWGVMLHFPELARPLGQFIAAAQQMSGLSERARQVVILTVGARMNSAYELYAHAALGVRSGLRPDQIATLSAGGRPVDLTEEETLAADTAAALTRGGVLPGPLYDTVVETLGHEALDTIVFVTVHYLTLGVILNAYDVPAGDKENDVHRPS